MPPRTVLTQRQKRLGSELRRMRTAAGMSAEYAAGLLGVDRSRISNMESGQRGINAERLRKLACNCDCTDEAYVEALVEMAEPSQAGWWERYRGSLPQGLLDISETEAYAVRLRGANTVHVPGCCRRLSTRWLSSAPSCRSFPSMRSLSGWPTVRSARA